MVYSFTHIGQLEQLFRRLFPFQRGLLHAYWAGNFWSIYSFIDKALRVLLSYSKPSLNVSSLGITQETSFDYLPNISASFTIFLILLFTVPLVICIWRNPRKVFFPYYLAFAIHTFFLFGYQVHEKALLMVITIYHAVSLDSSLSLHISTLLRISMGISAFPLIFRANGYFICYYRISYEVSLILY